MTLSIKISHNSPGYPMDAIVRTVNPADHSADRNPPVRLRDGESAEVYVHSGSAIVVDEAAPE